MQRTTVIEIDTPHGFRTAELLIGDITSLAFKVDVLVVSAFAGGYHPTPGSVIGALQSRLGICVADYEKSPALDLRAALGIWISTPLKQNMNRPGIAGGSQL